MLTPNGPTSIFSGQKVYIADPDAPYISELPTSLSPTPPHILDTSIQRVSSMLFICSINVIGAMPPNLLAPQVINARGSAILMYYNCSKSMLPYFPGSSRTQLP